MCHEVTLGDRFWSKVDKTETCWNWTRAKGWGYGSYRTEHNGVWRTVLCHRVAYEELVGPIPSNRVIDHLCRNRACVNPAHMELVTRGANVLRGVSAAAMHARYGRCDYAYCVPCRAGEKTHCKRGHEFDEANTYIAPNGQRVCRKCTAMRERFYRGRPREGDDFESPVRNRRDRVVATPRT